MLGTILEQFRLAGKKALVVGGAGDLGASMVEAIAEAGAQTVVIDLSDRVFQLCEALTGAGLSVSALKADVSDRAQIRTSFETALTTLGGRIDILINSAGIQRRHPSEVFPEKDWDTVIAVNLEATFFYSQLAANQMIPNGGGKIINIASMQSFFGGITIPAYAASKGGVSQLTKALSNDWAAKGICVNAIAPGYMDTQMNVALINDPVRNAEALSRIPMKRWGKGADLKGLVVFLASPASDYISGTVIPVDGGYLGR
jgi:2-deoxy-D-gluconate 3-dehydrogenase